MQQEFRACNGGAPRDTHSGCTSCGPVDVNSSAALISISNMIRTVMSSVSSTGSIRAPVFSTDPMTMASKLLHEARAGLCGEVLRVLPGSHNLCFCLRTYPAQSSTKCQHELLYRYAAKSTEGCSYDGEPSAVKRRLENTLYLSDDDGVDVKRQRKR